MGRSLRVRTLVIMAAEVTLWWAAALGVWLLTLSSVDQPDLVVAILAALPCAVAATAARRVLDGHWEVPARAFRWALRLPLAIPTDTVTVLAYPWRRLLSRADLPEGSWTRVPVEPGADDRSTSLRSAALALLSMTPGSFGVHSDADTGELLVHELAGGPAPMTEAVRR